MSQLLATVAVAISGFSVFWNFNPRRLIGQMRWSLFVLTRRVLTVEFAHLWLSGLLFLILVLAVAPFRCCQRHIVILLVASNEILRLRMSMSVRVDQPVERCLAATATLGPAMPSEADTRGTPRTMRAFLAV